MKIEELLESKVQEILAIAAKHGAPITFGLRLRLPEERPGSNPTWISL